MRNRFKRNLISQEICSVSENESVTAAVVTARGNDDNNSAQGTTVSAHRLIQLHFILTMSGTISHLGAVVSTSTNEITVVTTYISSFTTQSLW